VRRVEIEPTFQSWQLAARTLLRETVPPEEVVWSAVPSPFRGRQSAAARGAGASPTVRVPRQFLDLARRVASHRDPGRWKLLYRVLWRLLHESRDLLTAAGDPEVGRLHAMAAEATRSAPRAEARASHRGDDRAGGGGVFVAAGASLEELRAAAGRCTGCDLYRHATQTVFGQGPADARIVLVGEQPGDQEDLRGAPFVGPAGEVLDRALREAGLSRAELYVTNAVKHFKFVARGKRRIHDKPGITEIVACRPWLEAELAAIRPEILVCLGATAASALLGPTFRLLHEHGRFFSTRWAPRTIATLHPSAVLRGDDAAAQERLYRTIVADLRLVATAA
jgi:uracil-DNA glycosylase